MLEEVVIGKMAVQEPQAKPKAKTLHVRVADKAKEGNPVVNVRMPIGIVKFGLKMAKAYAPEMKDQDIDWDSIVEVIQEGETGMLVQVDDEAENKTVEVWVE